MLSYLRTAEPWIAPFDCTNDLDQVAGWPFGSRLTLGVGGVKEAVFEISEPTMKAQEGGRFEDNSGAQ